jgi:hypothetical protein
LSSAVQKKVEDALNLTVLLIFFVSVLSPQWYHNHEIEIEAYQQHHHEEATDDMGGLNNIMCFSEKSTVQVEGKGKVAMKDLNVGDRVLTARDDGDEEELYQPVYAFAHRHPTKSADFLQFRVKHHGGAPLEISGQHMVYLSGKENPVRADTIQVGDALQTTEDDGGNGTVTRIRTVPRVGVYAPLTPKGTIVVDGFVASTYLSLQNDKGENIIELKEGIHVVTHQQYFHMALAPFRLWCMGISSNMCTNYDQDGMPHYISFLLWSHEWAGRQNVDIRSLFLALVLWVTGFCTILENLFGAAWTPIVILASSGFLPFVWMNRVKQQEPTTSKAHHRAKKAKCDNNIR